MNDIASRLVIFPEVVVVKQTKNYSLSLVPLESLYAYAPSPMSERDGATESVSEDTARDLRPALYADHHTSYDPGTSLPISNSEARSPWELRDKLAPKGLKERVGRYLNSIIKTGLPKGWRFGAALAVIMSSCALTMNVAVAILSWVWTRHHGYTSNIAPVYTGKCTTVDTLGLVVHLGINIVSTLLLGASNYCMQIVCAPTRKDIDRAHEKGAWLDIGVQSISNLKHIKKTKLYAWLTLGLSSVPLHLIYNSTFFTSLGINAYDIYFATSGFGQGEHYDTDLFPHTYFSSSKRILIRQAPAGDPAWDPAGEDYHCSNPSLIQRNAPSFERLNNSDCMQRYGKDFVSDRRNLILVVADDANLTMSWTNMDVGGQGGPGEHNNVNHTQTCTNSSYGSEDLSSIPLGPMTLDCDTESSLISVGSYANEVIATSGINRPDAYYWICSHDRYTSTDMCSGHLSDLRADARSWTVYGLPIEYCLSERVEPRCSFNVSLTLLTVVIIFNLIKVSCVVLVVLGIEDRPLITVGDAIATFIEEPDGSTRGLCLVNRGMVDNQHWKKQKEGLIKSPDTYNPRSVRWYKAASKRRWLSSFLMITVGIGVILTLLIYAISDLRRRGDSDLGYLWRLGLGKIHSATLIQGWAIPTTGDSAVIGTVLIANLPQALLSFIYLVFNGLCTNMLLAFEWSKFASERRTLRVSEPRGAQRSTYFLQIPYRFGLPLAVLSSLLHWLVSQSIFLAKVDGLDACGWPSEIGNVTTCGYSPFGIIFTCMGGLFLAIFAVALGMQKLKPGMPLAGSCSVAISAACHVPDGTSELEPLMWGVVPKHPDDARSGVEHCAFANERLERPLPGRLYA